MNTIEFDSLKNNHPIYKSPNWKIYGPYQDKEDLRRRIVVYDGINRITISYPKFLMECYLNRLLEKDEEVHHKNELEFDDRIDNFEIKKGTIHKREHSKLEPEYFKCSCGNLIKLEGRSLSNFKSNIKKRPNMKGPYCSRSCAGKGEKK